ncbi:hypothetical protein AAU61_02810 [Desulfocarbo indianensis]|nr:hypothetical protein AAU61_02810 [Desulfocarbo indianensis]
MWYGETFTVNQAYDSTFSGDIDDEDGDGLFRKTGTGSLTLTGTVWFSDVRLSNGALVINGLVRRTVWIYNGTLSGTGAISRLYLNGGTLSPGNSIGALSITWCCDLDAGTYLVEVDRGVADKLDVNGLVSINNTLDVRGVPYKGYRFIIISNDQHDAVTGAFAGLAEGSTITAGGAKYRLSYAGGTGNDVTLTSLGPVSGGGSTPTPEPDPEPEPTPDPPAAPQVSQGSGPSPTGSLNGPALTWPHVDGSNFYRIYRAACPTCPKEQVGRVAGTSFTDESARPGGRFQRRRGHGPFVVGPGHGRALHLVPEQRRGAERRLTGRWPGHRPMAFGEHRRLQQ